MITCPNCGFEENPDDTEFCGACGSEIVNIPPSNSSPPIDDTKLDPLPPSSPVGVVKLVSKQSNCPIGEFILDSDNMIVGRFDPDTGPVDIDLEGFNGEDTISRNHAEIYLEAGQWKIKDLGSVNGVFIKRAGQTRFSARITTPEVLNLGDEVAIAKIRFLFES